MMDGEEAPSVSGGVFDVPVHGHATADTQTADAVLMVRPASFGWNPQTQASNRFQRDEPGLAGAANERACAEFDALALQLRAAGIAVSVAADVPTPVCPDAIFPNNWVSLHADGTVVLYPMLARNRRLERRLELIAALATGSGRRICRLLDLTQHELHGRFLEGTGSIVFDHARRIAYACLSPRTHPEPLAELCDELGYEPCTFTATDAAGVPIYHTNVMLAVGSRCCVVAASAIDARDRERVLSSLAASGRARRNHRCPADGRFRGQCARTARGGFGQRAGDVRDRACRVRTGGDRTTCLDRESHRGGADPDHRDARRRVRPLHARRGVPAVLTPRPRGTGC